MKPQRAQHQHPHRLHVEQHHRHTGRRTLDRREEKRPAEHHQQARQKHQMPGGPSQAQGASLATNQDPHCQAGQSECAAKPGRGQRAGMGHVHEHADGAEQSRPQQERQGARTLQATRGRGLGRHKGGIGAP
ncbi:hypothetical protein D3C72_1892620 [compost metagenome]